MPFKRKSRHAAIDVAEQHQRRAGDGGRHDLHRGQARRRRHQAAQAPLSIANRGDDGVDDQHGAGQKPAAGPAQRRVGEIVDGFVRDRNGAAGSQQLDHDALEAEQAGQRDDERGQPEPGDQRALKRAEGGGGDKRGEDRRPPRPGDFRLHEYGHDGRPDPGDVAQRKIDLAEQQHEHLAHADQHEHRALHEQVDEVAGGEEFGVLDFGRWRRS